MATHSKEQNNKEEIKKKAGEKMVSVSRAQETKQVASPRSKDKKETPVKVQTSSAYLKEAPVSPQKARLIADMVRGKKVSQAMVILSILNKKSAPIIKKVLMSAVANAENNEHLNRDSLCISRILVDEGIKYLRYRTVSRGRVFERVKRRSHILVEVSNQT